MNISDFILPLVLVINLGIIIKVIRKSYKDADVAYEKLMKDKHS